MAQLDRAAGSSHAGVSESEVAIRPAGVARALAATVFWSSSALQIDRLSGIYHLTPLEISVWRVGLVLPILIAIIAIRRPGAFHVAPADLALLATAGLVGIMLSYVAWASSVKVNGPAVAAALSFSAPAFIAIGERVLFGVRLRPVQVGAIAVNLAGCALASGVQDPARLVHSPTALLVGFLPGLTFSSYALLNRVVSRRRTRDPLTVLLVVFTVGAAGLLVWGGLAEGSRLAQMPLDLIGWALLVGVALGPTLLAYGLFNSSLRSLPATFAALVTTLEPPLVALGALVFLRRPGSGQQWLGIALIVGAVLVMQLSAMRSRPA